MGQGLQRRRLEVVVVKGKEVARLARTRDRNRWLPLPHLPLHTQRLSCPRLLGHLPLHRQRRQAMLPVARRRRRYRAVEQGEAIRGIVPSTLTLRCRGSEEHKGAVTAMQGVSSAVWEDTRLRQEAPRA
jgi:hypothetical protein